MQQLGLVGADDDRVLDRAIGENRVLVTRDRTTIPARITARLQSGAAIPGVVIARIEHVLLSAVIDALVLLLDAAEPGDWQTPVFIP